MSKAVLISIKPEWCDLIFRGKKTIEVRKTVPTQMETPFKVYIYCTKAPKGWLNLLTGEQLDSRVIGEFTCDHVYQYSSDYNSCRPVDGTDITTEEMVRQSCLSAEKLYRYEYSAEPKENCLYTVGLYGWHISGLVIYKKPKELSGFWKPCPHGEDSSCFVCDKSGYMPDMHIDCFNTITRPPQSWCYVEDVT